MVHVESIQGLMPIRQGRAGQNRTGQAGLAGQGRAGQAGKQAKVQFRLSLTSIIQV